MFCLSHVNPGFFRERLGSHCKSLAALSCAHSVHKNKVLPLGILFKGFAMGVPGWLRDLVDHATLDLWFVNLSPTLGIEIT